MKVTIQPDKWNKLSIPGKIGVCINYMFALYFISLGVSVVLNIVSLKNLLEKYLGYSFLIWLVGFFLIALFEKNKKVKVGPIKSKDL